MEYIIIFILIIIIFILYYLKQINFIRTLINIKNNHNKNNNLFDVSHFYKYKLLYYNPILINLYQIILKDIKYYNIYNHKSYIIFTNLKLSSSDIILLDWFGIINGIIKLSIDTIIKIFKKNKNILKSLGDNIKSLKLYYDTMYVKFSNKINNKQIYKFIELQIKKNIKQKQLKNNDIIRDLYYIYYIQRKLFLEIFKKSNKNNKIYFKISKYIKKNKDIYLLNLTLNNKLNNICSNNEHILKNIL
jgi:hypothetical protein